MPSIHVDHREVLVDPFDADHLSDRLRIVSTTHPYVAIGRRALHQIISGAKPGERTRAINGNFLDCRRKNLRIVRPGEFRAEQAKAREAKMAALHQAVQTATKLVDRLPSEFAGWSIQRTHLWMNLNSKLKKSLAAKKINGKRLQSLLSQMQELPTMPIANVDEALGRKSALKALKKTNTLTHERSKQRFAGSRRPTRGIVTTDRGGLHRS